MIRALLLCESTSITPRNWGAELIVAHTIFIVFRHYAASKSRIDIGRLLISRGADINARDKANQLPLHRAATTGSVGFIRLLLDSSTPSNKLRLNTGDRIGNTPLHLAMESAHAEAAVVLINAGADRSRENLDGETPEGVEGVGGTEQKNARQHVINLCGKP
ncbi:ankyrin repeat-containing domain protein [Cyathus striatus]|nr:ankyrin repeat-containing domain protein [Cyathus striatus]